MVRHTYLGRGGGGGRVQNGGIDPPPPWFGVSCQGILRGNATPQNLRSPAQTVARPRLNKHQAQPGSAPNLRLRSIRQVAT